jgi:hypothetical protein
MPFVWYEKDGCFVPKGGFTQRCSRFFKDGETVMLAPFEPRSMASHRGYFAQINELWANLPERLVDQFPTSEHLRKKALIDTGHYNDSVEVFETQAEAMAYMRGVKRDEFVICSLVDTTVVVRTAKSQRMFGEAPMSKAEFQKSKDDVLRWIEELIGLSPGAAA